MKNNLLKAVLLNIILEGKAFQWYYHFVSNNLF